LTRILPFRVSQYLGLGCLLCAGCASRPAALLPDQPDARLHLALQVTPVQPRQLDPTAFTVRVTDASGHPVTGASVTADLAMPTMDMGRNEVAARPGRPGSYTGTGRFTMSGAWQVAVTVRRGTEAARQSFPVNVQ